MNYVLIGGDARMQSLYRRLKGDGESVFCYAMETAPLPDGAKCTELPKSADVYVLPLPSEKRRGHINAPFCPSPPETARRLREKVRRHYTEETGYHLDTGIVLTPVLIRYLTDAGMADIAYWIMTAPDYPSYAAMLEGETTLSEHWSRRWPDYRIGADGSSIVKGGQELSHCHPMLGSTVAWLYERVAGLELTRLCEGVVTVHPAVLELLTHAAAEKETPFGKAAVAWRRENGTVQLTVEIPNALRGEVEMTYPAAAATVCGAKKYTAAMPEGRLRLQLPAGRWTITLTREDEEP